MAIPLSGEDGRQSLAAHVAAKGAEIHEKFGPTLGWQAVQRLLEDRSCVRYPCVIAFDASHLEPGEMAYAAPTGDRPEDGFTIHIHPFFMTQLDKVAYVVLYQLVVVNYGEFAGPEDAEVFGAAAVGLTRDAYYAALCELADSLPLQPPLVG